jgi:hypothetical protein
MVTIALAVAAMTAKEAVIAIWRFPGIDWDVVNREPPNPQSVPES